MKKEEKTLKEGRRRKDFIDSLIRGINKTHLYCSHMTLAQLYF